jgi:hypothetical protein
MARVPTLACVLTWVLAGCSSSPQQPSGTGAKECVQAYYEALIQQDWLKAYASLDPQDQRRCNSHQFSQLARNYRSSLSFEPVAVRVWACEERDTEATAHVTLTGRGAKKEARYKDGVTLRRGDDGWRVVLPPNFGRANQ